MFNMRVLSTEAFPESLMNKVCVRRDGLDDTLFMTATILLYKRVENLKITYTLDKVFDPDVISRNKDVYSFHWFEGVNTPPDELLNPLKEDFKRIEKLPTHEEFLSEQLKQRIFIRLMPEENTVCLFTSNVTLPIFHCAQFFIPKYFNIFKEKPLTKDEISFLETLTYKMNGNYVSKLSDLAYSESFRAYLFKDQLEAFEKKLFERKVQAAQDSLNTIEDAMRKAMDDYKKACDKRVEAIALVAGLKTMADQVEEHTELQDYLMNNKRICNVSINDSTISYVVKTYLAPHHVDEWEVMTTRAHMFDQYVSHTFNDRNDIKLLLDAIFSENRCLKLRMCAYFAIDYFGGYVNSQINHRFTTAGNDLVNYVPNPHLHHHNCFGQNKLAIVEQLACGDAIGAIECSIACAQRINIHESMSFGPFVRDLLACTGKCLVANNGTELTVSEAIKYLKEQSHD